MTPLSMCLLEPSVGAELALGHGLEGRRAVVEAEAVLWASAAAGDCDRLGWLLHHDFTGVTREGERLGRDQLLAAAVRAPAAGERVFGGWTFHALPWPLVLVTYGLTDASGASRHLSVWDFATGLARIRFHQGAWVPVSADV